MLAMYDNIFLPSIHSVLSKSANMDMSHPSCLHVPLLDEIGLKDACLNLRRDLACQNWISKSGNRLENLHKKLGKALTAKGCVTGVRESPEKQLKEIKLAWR
jgi:hypothetical protein